MSEAYATNERGTGHNRTRDGSFVPIGPRPVLVATCTPPSTSSSIVSIPNIGVATVHSRLRASQCPSPAGTEAYRRRESGSSTAYLWRQSRCLSLAHLFPISRSFVSGVSLMCLLSLAHLFPVAAVTARNTSARTARGHVLIRRESGRYTRYQRIQKI